MYSRYRDFLKPRDQNVIESGSSTAGIVPLPLPDGAEVHCQTLWGSIGWATGATLGIALADPSRRTVLFTGEGSHQLVATLGEFDAAMARAATGESASYIEVVGGRMDFSPSRAPPSG
jgi:TPP-dependent 2-oxoacid decarboxylase